MKSINSVIFAIIAFPVVLSGCATTEEIKFSVTRNHSLRSEFCAKSSDMIDQFETREIYITLEKKEKCVRFDIVGFAPRESIKGGEDQIPVFWILDRIIPEPGRKTAHSEVFRNFDADWKSLSSSQICSVIDRPLERLDPGQYRIRFTIFRQTPYRIELGTFSNGIINVSTSKPEGP